MSSWRIDACEPLCSARRQRHSQTVAARNESGASLSPRVAASAARSRASSVRTGEPNLRRSAAPSSSIHAPMSISLAAGAALGGKDDGGSHSSAVGFLRGGGGGRTPPERSDGPERERERWNWRSKACAVWSAESMGRGCMARCTSLRRRPGTNQLMNLSGERLRRKLLRFSASVFTHLDPQLAPVKFAFATHATSIATESERDPAFQPSARRQKSYRTPQRCPTPR